MRDNFTKNLNSATEMVFELLRLSIDISDDDFNAIYPENIRLLAQKHWTPVCVAKAASEFLVDRPGTRVLDIGSGVGKFCMVGASNTKGHFTGVEQRAELVELSRRLCVSHLVHNVKYVHDNIMFTRFSDYNAFYLYNSFYENIDFHNRIDDTLRLNAQLYDIYSMHTVEQLSGLPVGVRLATYYTSITIVPQTFRLVDSLYDGHLRLWEKIF